MTIMDDILASVKRIYPRLDEIRDEAEEEVDDV